MENKLHTAADSLRRERDAAQRKHWTAQERLRLTMEEVQAMEATVESLLKSRQSLEEQLSHSKELPELELHVQTLSKEVQFQHSELVQKRAKLTQMNQTNASNDERRQAALQKLENTVHRQRSKPVIAGLWTVGNIRDALQIEADNDYDGRLAAKWTDLVERKTRMISEQVETLKNECDSLHGIVDGYREHFQLTLDGSNTSADTTTAEECIVATSKSQDHENIPNVSLAEPANPVCAETMPSSE